MSGLESQDRLASSGYERPWIVITAHENETVRARAIEEGASAFLQKPFGEQGLLEAITRELGRKQGSRVQEFEPPWKERKYNGRRL
jgi:FixJ family two-component response regulator